MKSVIEICYLLYFIIFFIIFVISILYARISIKLDIEKTNNKNLKKLHPRKEKYKYESWIMLYEYEWSRSF